MGSSDDNWNYWQNIALLVNIAMISSIFFGKKFIAELISQYQKPIITQCQLTSDCQQKGPIYRDERQWQEDVGVSELADHAVGEELRLDDVDRDTHFAVGETDSWNRSDLIFEKWNMGGIIVVFSSLSRA